MANGFPSALSCLTSWVGTTFTPSGAELNLAMAQMAEYSSPLLPPWWGVGSPRSRAASTPSGKLSGSRSEAPPFRQGGRGALHSSGGKMGGQDIDPRVSVFCRSPGRTGSQ